ncbi:hypothetical protein [Lonepinella sp. BR2357]|uniref:hypothetical protein n=1 Tax=Lonepinella sp. BR2357 TaxID=3434549 RepID=UPI003F6DB66B
MRKRFNRQYTPRSARHLKAIGQFMQVCGMITLDMQGFQRNGILSPEEYEEVFDMLTTLQSMLDDVDFKGANDE